MTAPARISDAVREVIGERVLQDAKWGEQNHPDGLHGRPEDVAAAAVAKRRCQANGPGQDNWRDIFEEEWTEAMAEADPLAMRDELVQAAAVLVAWVEAIDRRLTASSS